MNKLAILVVTRNRLDALIDALESVKRINSLINTDLILEVFIQDNSDISCPESIIEYFGKHFDLNYIKTRNILSMSSNWNEGLRVVAQSSCQYACVLADRRLMTTNIVQQ